MTDRTTSARLTRAAAPIGVLVLAAGLRLWALDRPDSLVFDELYYVRDAVSQLAHGLPTTWPDDDPEFGGARARAFSDEPSIIAHPPLGKWVIALGVLALGADSGWGWRIAVALAGVLAVAATMRLGWLMTRSLGVATAAGLLLAIDGVHVVLSRVALLDGILTLAIVIGTACLWRYLDPAPHRRSRPGHDPPAPGSVARTGSLWWLAAAGAWFGAATAVKWSGLFVMVAMWLLLAAVEITRRRTASAPHPWARGFGRAVSAGSVLAGASAAAYAASWIGWIRSPIAPFRELSEPWWSALARWHAEALAWHSTLTAPHPYQSHPLSWPLGLRPTAMYESRWSEGGTCPWMGGCAAVVSPLPNVLVTWGGVLALLVLAIAVARTARRPTRATLVSAGVLTGYLAGWLPWLLQPGRSAVFQFYTVVLTPFAALALALVLAAVWRAGPARPAWDVSVATGVQLPADPAAVRERRIATALYVALALAVAAFFFPVWSGMPVAEWFARAHAWLPGWR